MRRTGYASRYSISNRQGARSQLSLHRARRDLFPLFFEFIKINPGSILFQHRRPQHSAITPRGKEGQVYYYKRGGAGD